MTYLFKLTRFLESLYCCYCHRKNLFGRLSCLAFDKNRGFFLAWCSACTKEGEKVLNDK
jgi:hypothetical protein